MHQQHMILQIQTLVITLCLLVVVVESNHTTKWRNIDDEQPHHHHQTKEEQDGTGVLGKGKDFVAFQKKEVETPETAERHLMMMDSRASYSLSTACFLETAIKPQTSPTGQGIDYVLDAAENQLCNKVEVSEWLCDVAELRKDLEERCAIANGRIIFLRVLCDHPFKDNDEKVELLSYPFCVGQSCIFDDENTNAANTTNPTNGTGSEGDDDLVRLTGFAGCDVVITSSASFFFGGFGGSYYFYNYYIGRFSFTAIVAAALTIF